MVRSIVRSLTVCFVMAIPIEGFSQSHGTVQWAAGNRYPYGPYPLVRDMGLSLPFVFAVLPVADSRSPEGVGCSCTHANAAAGEPIVMCHWKGRNDYRASSTMSNL